MSSIKSLPELLPVSFYNSLFDGAVDIYAKARNRLLESSDGVSDLRALLDRRTTEQGLSATDTATLLAFVRDNPIDSARQIIIDAARVVRQHSFGDSLAAMVPIEVTSYCASTCKFCGWRADNKDMVRLAITEEAIREQAKILAGMGFSHFEIAGGDHLPFLRSGLASLISALKQETRAINPDSRVSMCLVPMHESQYASLKQQGLDCVLTWQETYQRDLFNFHIPSGPKATGIDLDFKMVPSGDGFMARLQSQEFAIRSGLQAGIGTMIGLANEAEADILAAVLHGQKLIEHYGAKVLPLVIGMPAWNAITTDATDNRHALSRPFDTERNFELIAAIYLLAFPDQRAWVFANGRVNPEVQTNCVVTASCFTSTLVQIAPGAYLGLNPELTKGTQLIKFFAKKSLADEEVTQENILSGEQFMHYLMSHDEFVSKFTQRGMRMVSDQSLLDIRASTALATEAENDDVLAVI
jgi:2-iminoacetate synthase